VLEEDRIGPYKQAYEDWQRQLTQLHEVFLEGKRIPPIQIKGLLNREARAKRRYDRARLHLLGIEGDDDLGDEEGDDD
jgi:hypothetical protein